MSFVLDNEEEKPNTHAQQEERLLASSSNGNEDGETTISKQEKARKDKLRKSNRLCLIITAAVVVLILVVAGGIHKHDKSREAVQDFWNDIKNKASEKFGSGYVDYETPPEKPKDVDQFDPLDPIGAIKASATLTTSVDSFMDIPIPPKKTKTSATVKASYSPPGHYWPPKPLFPMPEPEKPKYPVPDHYKPIGYSNEDPADYKGPDYLADFKGAQECGYNSRDFYLQPAETRQKLCRTKKQVLKSMSWGGRIGFEQPFQSYDCAHKWYDSTELCTLLSKFREVIFVGDSVMLHLVQAMGIFLREDLRSGGLRTWSFNDNTPISECTCGKQFGPRKDCSYVHGFDDQSELKGKSEQKDWFCPNANIKYVRSHLPDPEDADTSAIVSALSQDTSSNKPIAVILEHGLHSQFIMEKALAWLDAHIEPITDRWPYQRIKTPILFIPTDNPGAHKPELWWCDQGYLGTWRYQLRMEDECRVRGVDNVNTWNMTAQTFSYDGTNHDLGVHLVKAQFVFNWLDKVYSEQLSPLEHYKCNDIRGCRRGAK